MAKTSLVIVLLALAMVAAARQRVPVLAIEHVTVVPMDRERVLADQTVIVSGDRIDAIGARDVRIPGDAVRVDGRGKFLIPALAEMHAHLPANEAEAERVLLLYAVNGIGTIRSMLGDPVHFRIRERARRGELVAPATIHLAGPSFSGQTVTTAEAARARVEAQKKAGYDLLKIHPGVSRAAFDALAATAQQLRIPFAGHVPADVGLARALEAKYSTIDHLDGYVEALARPGAPASQLFGANLAAHVDESRLPALVAETRTAGTWNVPTQILMENWLGPTSAATLRTWPEMRYVSTQELDQWSGINQKNEAAFTREQRERVLALRRRIIKALHDGGAGLLLGSDAPQVWNVPGFSIHRELTTYVAAGLTPFQALATGTRNVAVHTGTLQRAGTIEAGKRADLVLLDGNPLQDITHTGRIAGVVIAGRWLARAELDRRLASAVRR
jgi:imidazolonepropionase-like amidohydrolase